MESLDEDDGKEPKRRSSDPTTPTLEKGRKGRRASVAIVGICGGASGEKKKNVHGKPRKIDYEKKKIQKKMPKFGARKRKVDPLNLMSLSQKGGNSSPKIDSPQICDRGLNFDPDNLRPVDATDPLKLNNLDDTVLAVKVNSHKRKRKRRRRRTYSENDKDMKTLLETMGHDGDTEASETELHSPKRVEFSPVKSEGKLEKERGETVKCVDQRGECEAMDEGMAFEESETKCVSNVAEEAEKTLEKETMNCAKMQNEIIENVPSKETNEKDKTVKTYNIKFREKDKKFQYGNYNRYYGYRNPNMAEDDRIEYLQREWFEGKDCLDIGCNVGHLTLYIARHFNPKFFMGIDIDDSLIRAARRNVQHYVPLNDPQAPKQSDFPISFPICYGPLSTPLPPEKDGKSFGFPYNISFKTENFVDFEWNKISIKPGYDFIMCLSVTKWIQLNWGDDGVKKLFKRIFLTLHPGGKLLLEPQPWKSYKKKKNLTATTRSNYDKIKLKPDKYIQYLLSNEVGFATSEKLGIPKHKAQGFQRPIYLLTKGGS